LRDHKGKIFEEGLNWGQDGCCTSDTLKSITDDDLDQDEPDWIIEQSRARKRREMLRHREDMEARLAKIRAKEKAQRNRYLKGDQAFKKRKTEIKSEDDDEEQYLLDDYESDDDKGSRGISTTNTFSQATLELMKKVGMGPVTPEDEDEEVEDEIKVIAID
jgi:chromosome transmission fidelity protein 1